MQWNNLPSDITIDKLSQIVSRLECNSAVRFLSNIMRESRIYILNDCLDLVMNHVRSDRKEVGGILLGRVFENNLSVTPVDKPVVLILSAVSSEVCRNSPVSLEMDTEIWNRVNSRVDDKCIVVGWYHSHPNIGAYFSGTDRRTQRAFFNHPYSVGLVIDPFRNERKLYFGMDAEEYQSELLILNHGLAI